MSIVSDVQLILNDTGTFWTLPQVLDSINEAQFWIFAKTKWSRISSPLVMHAGQDIIQIPPTILIPGWIEGTIQNNNPESSSVMRMFPTTQRELENFLRTWRGAGLAQPSYFSIWDSTHLRIFPRPDQDYTYTVWGIGFPIEILDNTTTITGPSLYVLGVKHYSVGLLLEATRPDLADQYYKLADQNVLDFRRQLRNQQSHNIRRLRIGRRLDIQQSGTIRELPVYYPLEC